MNRPQPRMTIPEQLKVRLQWIAEEELSKAESVWDEKGVQLEAVKKARQADTGVGGVYQSFIPDHPLVHEGRPEVTQFVAMVVDIRESTKHIEEGPYASGLTGFQRVLYETQTFLPCVDAIVSEYGGRVVEYLGDGVLALFSAEKDRDDTVRRAHAAAKLSIEAALQIVNPLLYQRHQLPRMKVGAGLSIGPALVTVVGIGSSRQPKAFGRCVWHATKASGGNNAVCFSVDFMDAFPRAKDGNGFSYVAVTLRGVLAHQVYKVE